MDVSPEECDVITAEAILISPVGSTVPDDEITLPVEEAIMVGNTDDNIPRGIHGGSFLVIRDDAVEADPAIIAISKDDGFLVVP